MVERIEKEPEKNNPLSFETGMREAAEILLESLWKDSVKPTVAKLFSRHECHTAARRAGTDVLARLVKDDPETDKLYA